MPSNTDENAGAADSVRIYRPADVTLPETKGVVPEIGGRKDGTDPTRFGDWEKNGRCIDF